MVEPDPELTADGLRFFFRGDLVADPEPRGIDEHEIPGAEPDVLEDPLDLGPELDEVSETVRRRDGPHVASLGCRRE